MSNHILPVSDRCVVFNQTMQGRDTSDCLLLLHPSHMTWHGCDPWVGGVCAELRREHTAINLVNNQVYYNILGIINYYAKMNECNVVIGEVC